MAANSGKAGIIIYLDMTKAFDCVPHSLLLDKIKSYGVVDPLFSWISSYLSARSQVVCVDEHLSEPKPVCSGVIQGSVLGPVLFLIYINDVLKVIQHGTPFIFADDIKILYTCDKNSLPMTLTNINRDLESLSCWCRSWQMKFSAEKSSVMTYKCSIPPGTLYINKIPILYNPSVRDLGLQYSCTFNFSEHTAFQIAKAKRSIGLIHKNFLLNNSKIHLFKMLTRPLLEYCPLVCTNMNKKDRISLESVQRSFTKQLVGYSSSLSYQERCDIFHLEPLWLRRIKLNLVFLYKLLHRLAFSRTQITFTQDTHYPLRHRDHCLPVTRSRTAIRSQFFLVQYSSLWNKLPPIIRQSSSLPEFRSLISKTLTVECVLQMTNTSISTSAAYELGLAF